MIEDTVQDGLGNVVFAEDGERALRFSVEGFLN